jgi:myo-inositol-1(or 4)-monophosphatase
MHKEFLKAVIDANKEIYTKIKDSFDSSWYNELNIGAGGDVSLAIDIFAERVFIEHLQKFGSIDSEECGKIGKGDFDIIIDPIDGSSNFASNFPYYGSSVALKKENVVEVAVVCNFANGDIFYKIKKEPLMFGNIIEGNFVEEQSVKSPKIALFEKAYDNSLVIKKLASKGLKFRAPGATALSLAYAHRVKFVLFIGDIREYDIAAGLAFCSDLKVSISKDYVIVTKEIELLNMIESIINEVKDESR